VKWKHNLHPKLADVVQRGVPGAVRNAGGRVFSGWLKIERCERCGLKYLANEGDLWAFPF
jgi:uncharacterized protein (DUF983 family)